MTPARPSDPVVGVRAEAPRLQMLVARLKAAGLGAFALREGDNQEMPRVEAILIDGPIDIPDQRRLSVSFPGAAIVAMQPVPLATGIDLIPLENADQFAWLKTLLLVRRRSELRVAERELRAKTLKDFGQPANGIDRSPRHVLFGGGPGPRLLAIQSAFRRAGVRVTCALTPAMFALHMKDAALSLIMFEAGETSAFMSAWQKAIDESAWLAALPAVCVATAKTEIRGCDALDLVLSGDVQPDGIVDAALNCVPEDVFRTEKANSSIIDRYSNLPSRTFFERHLHAQIEHARAHFLAHSVLAFRLIRTEESTAPLKDFASTLTRYLRAEDIASRIDWRTVCVSLRGLDFNEAIRAGGRLANCLEHALEDRARFAWRVVEMRHSHNASSLIELACSGPFEEMRSAASRRTA